MKIITFWGGLGNQIFEYAYYLWLQNKYPHEKIYSFFPAIGLSAHNGLEIDKCFEISLPKTTNISDIIGKILFNVNRICRRLHLPQPMTCTQENARYSAIFHCDYWQDRKFIPENLGLNFKLNEFSEKNESLLDLIKKRNVVSVHVRRCDYLKAENTLTFGGICTDEYYQKALAQVEKTVDAPYFLFFSDDSQFVREHYHYSDMQVVDWNIKEKSIIDMYLMSRCSYMVLANSTFSYWAARLNKGVKEVWCPPKWTNINEPDIIMNKWIKI